MKNNHYSSLKLIADKVPGSRISCLKSATCQQQIFLILTTTY